jgi:hypothetical protein
VEAHERGVAWRGVAADPLAKVVGGYWSWSGNSPPLSDGWSKFMLHLPVGGWVMEGGGAEARRHHVRVRTYARTHAR